MQFGPVLSRRRNFQLKEQSLLLSRSCVFPVCNRTILFENSQNLESAISLIATAITMRQQKENSIRISLVWKLKKTVKGTCATSVLRVKGLLQIVELKLSSITSSSNTLVLCDSACSHSWISVSLAEKLKLSGEKLNILVSGINSQ